MMGFKFDLELLTLLYWSPLSGTKITPGELEYSQTQVILPSFLYCTTYQYVMRCRHGLELPPRLASVSSRLLCTGKLSTLLNQSTSHS